jgi:hypothetical protein
MVARMMKRYVLWAKASVRCEERIASRSLRIAVRMRVSSGLGSGDGGGGWIVEGGVVVVDDDDVVVVFSPRAWDGDPEDGCVDIDAELGAPGEDEEFAKESFANSLARSSREELQKRMYRSNITLKKFS